VAGGIEQERGPLVVGIDQENATSGVVMALAGAEAERMDAGNALAGSVEDSRASVAQRIDAGDLASGREQEAEEDDQQNIRESRNRSYFFLPADEELGLQDGYADFRQITCLDPEVVSSLGKRRASLSADGRRLLQTQLFRFFTRRELPAS
jgi:hypothetical protein